MHFVLFCFSRIALLIVKEFRVWRKNVGIPGPSIAQAAGGSQGSQAWEESSRGVQTADSQRKGWRGAGRRWQGSLEGLDLLRRPWGAAAEGSSRGGRAGPLLCSPGKQQSWAGEGTAGHHWGAPATHLPSERYRGVWEETEALPSVFCCPLPCPSAPSQMNVS